jgi:hypothetical protein
MSKLDGWLAKPTWTTRQNRDRLLRAAKRGERQAAERQLARDGAIHDVFYSDCDLGTCAHCYTVWPEMTARELVSVVEERSRWPGTWDQLALRAVRVRR